MNQDLLRLIDSICRDKNIEREGFVADLENAMTSAVRKAYDDAEDTVVDLDLLTGRISATVNGEPVDMHLLGRIAAQTAKQVIIQRTRERERLSIFDEFTERRGTIVTGQVVRIEKGNLLVNIGRTEGFLPRSEQIPGETHQVGDRIRVLVHEVRELPNQVKIILSRADREFIVRLFELEVPEVAERIIEIRALAREAGYRTKVAVSSIDSKVDAVGACVGVRGSRIKNIVDELGGEKIDIVRYNESSQILIQNALKPAEVQEIALCLELGKATVVVAEDQLSLAIGKRGQNVRLAARLTGWDIDILTPAEYNKNLEHMESVLRTVEGVDELLIDKLVAIGCVSIQDVDDVGPEPLVQEMELDAELAERICEAAGEEVIRIEEEKEAAEKAKALAGPSAETPGASSFVSDEIAGGQPAAADVLGDDTLAGTTPETAAGGDDVLASPSAHADDSGDLGRSVSEAAEAHDRGDEVLTPYAAVPAPAETLGEQTLAEIAEEGVAAGAPADDPGAGSPSDEVRGEQHGAAPDDDATAAELEPRPQDDRSPHP